MTTSAQTERIHKALDTFVIELPSWGFANTGTRFGKFIQASAATTTEEKLNDAGQVHHFTGCCPSVATHVLWDFPEGLKSTPEVMASAAKAGVRLGAINPNVFQDQIYKNGSLGNPDAEIRQAALNHILESIEIGKQTGSQDVSLWFADGSSYPGTASIRHRKQWFAEGLQEAHAHLSPKQRMLVEYKPFEPYFYHTDLGDWGMALIQSRHAGPQAKVLVDTGHHYQAQNIEQIVAWLLSEDMLGGFHFNDRRYADDDLTLGSIDPYQVFRIFNEVIGYRAGDRQARRHRLHDRPEPQPEGQDRGNDPNGRHGAGTLRQSRAGGSREADPLPDEGRIDRRRRVPEVGLCQRCAPGHPGMAARARDWRRIRCKPSAPPATRSGPRKRAGRRTRGRWQATREDRGHDGPRISDGSTEPANWRILRAVSAQRTHGPRKSQALLSALA